MGVTSNGNVFNRAGAQTARWLTVWSRGRLNVDPSVYTSLKAHRAGTHQDPTSRAYYGPTVVGNDGTLSRTVRARAATSAVPLPADIAALAGATAGTRHLGVFGRG
jgi:hypothetical protein